MIKFHPNIKFMWSGQARRAKARCGSVGWGLVGHGEVRFGEVWRGGAG